MSKQRNRAALFLAVVAMVCARAPPPATAQDNPNPSGRAPAASRYLSRSAVPGLRGRPRYEQSLQPANSIQVTVHYPDAYGYRHLSGLFDAAPNSCDAFSVSIVPADANPNQPTGIHVAPAMRRANGLYWCDYSAQDLPTDVPIDVRVALSDERTLPTEAWMGGIEPQPPTGQRRIIGGEERTVVLNAAAPRAALVFWMDYAAQSPQFQRSRQPLQRPLQRVGPPIPDPEFKPIHRDLPAQKNTAQRPVPEGSLAQSMQPRPR